MKKISLYLDTSVLNFYFAKDSPDEMQVTKELFVEIKRGEYEAFISATVLEEISKASDAKKRKLLNLVREYKLTILKINEETEELAGKYIKSKIIPKRFEEDAIHIAAAVVNNLDVIISWNFKHIVKLKTKLAVNEISRQEGYKEIEIYSPKEVIKL